MNIVWFFVIVLYVAAFYFGVWMMKRAEKNEWKAYHKMYALSEQEIREEIGCDLSHMVRKISFRAGIEAPEILVLPSLENNKAFVMCNEGRWTVFLSMSFLWTEKKQLEGIISHEIAHILHGVNHRPHLISLGCHYCSIISFFFCVIVLFFESMYAIVVLFCTALIFYILEILCLVLSSIIMRSGEYQADRTALSLTSFPADFALWLSNHAKRGGVTLCKTLKEKIYSFAADKHPPSYARYLVAVNILEEQRPKM